MTAILSAAAVFASFSDRLDVVNHISVGDVSISISEYARKGKGEVKYTQPSEVVPGQTISKIPRIKNQCTSLLDQGQNHIYRGKRKTGTPER